MKIHIKVHANSSQEKVEKIDEQNYEVWITEKPVDNKANLRLSKLLGQYFGKEIKITSGLSSNKKIIEL